MKNQSLINAAIANIGFELELSDKETHINSNNPHAVATFISFIDNEYADALSNNAEAQKAFTNLKTLLDEHHAQSVGVSKDDLKAVYQLLKDRKIHPKGIFDKMGRFYLEDDELVDVRSPSAKYPFSQMNAGRTAKFVKAIAEKYKVQSKDELLALFATKN